MLVTKRVFDEYVNDVQKFNFQTLERLNKLEQGASVDRCYGLRCELTSLRTEVNNLSKTFIPLLVHLGLTAELVKKCENGCEKNPGSACSSCKEYVLIGKLKRKSPTKSKAKRSKR